MRLLYNPCEAQLYTHTHTYNTSTLVWSTAEVFQDVHYSRFSGHFTSITAVALDIVKFVMMEVIVLTSRWDWRYPPCPGWPAKETLLPARPPPPTKPSCLSLRPHRHLFNAILPRAYNHHLHSYLQPHTLATHCNHTALRHEVRWVRKFVFSLPRCDHSRRRSDHLSTRGRQCELRFKCTETLTKKMQTHKSRPGAPNTLLSHKKMATFNYNDPSLLTTPP